MNDVFVTLIETILHNICLLVLSVNIIGAGVRWKRLLPAFLCYIPVTLVAVFCDRSFSMFIMAVMHVVMITFLKFSLTGIRMRSLVMMYVIIMTSNAMTGAILLFLTSVNKAVFPYLELSVNLVSVGLIALLCFSEARSNIKQLLIWTPDKVKYLLTAFISCCSLLSLVIINIDYYNHERIITIIKILVVIFMLLLAVIVPLIMIYATSNKHIRNQSKKYEDQIKAQLEYYVMLSESNFEMRRFRHDYNNMCIGLSKLIEEGKNEQALELLRNNEISIKNYSIRFDTGNGIADALLADKQKQADKINAKIIFEGAVPKDLIKTTDICVIFGNTIDNALEACSKIKSDEPKIISVNCMCSSGFMFLEITNPVAERVVLGDQLPMTTKPDKAYHGFGLYSLRQAIKAYDGELTLTCDEKTFRLSLEMTLSGKETADALTSSGMVPSAAN